MQSPNPSSSNAQTYGTRTILEVLADVLSVPAAHDDEARQRLQSLKNSYAKRTKEIVGYLLGFTSAEVFLEKRGGASLGYVLWWLRSHGRDHYEEAAKAALRAAVKGNWPLDKGYENLSKVAQVQPYLPPPPEKKKGDHKIGGVFFISQNNLTIAVNCQSKDMFTFSMQHGAMVYIWSTSDKVEIRVDGRSGRGLPQMPLEWITIRTNRSGEPTYYRLPRAAREEEMDPLVENLWQKMDRRWKDPQIPTAIGGSAKHYK